jgi:phage FluMu protein Com
MAIELRCPGCGRMLRVAELHTGKKLRCPACQHISTAAPPGESAAAEGDQATWHLRTPDGQIFGPVGWPQMVQWAAEGRIAADCFLGNSASGPWRGAAEIFPSLRSTAKPVENLAPPSQHLWAPPEATGVEGFGASPMQLSAGPAGSGYVRPHRGGLILVLGVLGVAVNCPIFCFMAWVMGSADLAEMRAGRMDKSGEGVTRVGQVLGMILSLFWIIGGVAVAAMILLAAVAGQ